MVTLGIGIGDMRLAYPQHFFQHNPVCEHRLSQLGPILPLAARNYIVNGGKGELLMIQVAV